MVIAVRDERAGDQPAIFALNALAFGREAEAVLVDRLRVNGGLLSSLVAVDGADGEHPQIVGHIAFSPVVLTREDGVTRIGVGLAPMAVLPARQRDGIGSQLVRAGLQRLQRAGESFCVVLGHPAYYPRFGFTPASAFGVRWEHPALDPTFMAIELVPDALRGWGGVVRYRPELGA
jgi:putative acetyltransferase